MCVSVFVFFFLIPLFLYLCINWFWSKIYEKFQSHFNVYSYLVRAAHTFETFLCKRDAAWAMNLGNGLFWLVALVFVAYNLSFGGTRESQLRIGKAINIFVRYGYLGISMRVIPYNDSYEMDKWLFKEPTKSIYKVHMHLMLYVIIHI